MILGSEPLGSPDARRLIGALDDHLLGLDRMVLETGNLQVEALAFYQSAGYSVIPCFGEYAASGSSICFEKSIVPIR